MLNGHQDRALLGIGLMLGAYFLFSFIDASAKWLGQLGLPALQLAFMRYFGHFVISTGLVGCLVAACASSFLSSWSGDVQRGLADGLNRSEFFAVTYLPLTDFNHLFSAGHHLFSVWPLLGGGSHPQMVRRHAGLFWCCCGDPPF